MSKNTINICEYLMNQKNKNYEESISAYINTIKKDRTLSLDEQEILIKNALLLKNTYLQNNHELINGILKINIDNICKIINKLEHNK